jgi:acyl-CoA thioester hydrolase
MGHMNVMWYVGKFDEASWQLLATMGLTPSRLRSEGRGMAAVEQRIEYKRELYAGDVVTIRSAVVEIREKSIRIAHELRNDDTGAVAATTVIVGVHLDLTSRKASPLPADVRDRGILMMDDGAAADRLTAHEMELATGSVPVLSGSARPHDSNRAAFVTGADQEVFEKVHRHSRCLRLWDQVRR